MTQAEKIEYILDKSCEYFGMSRADLISRKFTKIERAIHSKFIIKALRDNTMLPTAQIASLLGYKSNANVLYHNEVISDEVSDECYGNAKIKRLYKEYLNHLNLNNYDKTSEKSNGH